jgi:DICT domain-containing protein
MLCLTPDFSVYYLLGRLKQETSIVTSRRAMNIISHAIEDATLIHQARGRIFSGFQRFSRFLPQIKRYRGLAERSDEIYVFGVPDVSPPPIPNVRYVPLEPHDQLAKEWFLISYGREFYSALVTEELTQLNTPDSLRQFRGVWTFDREMVSILDDWLASAVDAHLIEYSAEQFNIAKQYHILAESIQALRKRLQDNAAVPELHYLIEQHLKPALAAS